MKYLLTILAFTTLLCTRGRAQIVPLIMDRTTTNVAFIKGETGFLIDRISVQTSTTGEASSFPFPDDTLFLDIEIVAPMDEIIVEAFAKEHVFGTYRCWLDAPTANVYLSIVAGKLEVDSVSLSPIDTWFRQQVGRLNATENPRTMALELRKLITDTEGTLLSAKFLEAYLNLPFITRNEVGPIMDLMEYYRSRAAGHPYFDPLYRRFEILTSTRNFKLAKYALRDQRGRPVSPENPGGKFFVLNYYESTDILAQEEHKLLKEAMVKDSLFKDISVISISAESSEALWKLYVKDGDYSWPHYYERPGKRKMLSEQLSLGFARSYVVVNQRGQVQGVYESLLRLAEALQWAQTTGKKGG